MLLPFPTGVDPLLILLAALALDMVVGDLPMLFRFVPHPIQLVGRAVSWFDERLNRERRDERTRRVRGVLTVAALITAAAVIGVTLTFLLHALRFGWLVEIGLVAVLLAQRSLFEYVARVGLPAALQSTIT